MILLAVKNSGDSLYTTVVGGTNHGCFLKKTYLFSLAMTVSKRQWLLQESIGTKEKHVFHGVLICIFIGYQLRSCVLHLVLISTELTIRSTSAFLDHVKVLQIRCCCRINRNDKRHISTFGQYFQMTEEYSTHPSTYSALFMSIYVHTMYVCTIALCCSVH